MEYPDGGSANPEGEGTGGHDWEPRASDPAGPLGRQLRLYAAAGRRQPIDARNSAFPGHAYGTDTGGTRSRTRTYDLSNDPLAWGRQRADMLRDLISRVPEIALADNMPYYEATDLFQSYFFQYARALAPTVKYIGGQHQYRDHVGDPQGRMPFVPVPREDQVEALDMIIEYAFRPGALDVPQEVFQQFGANRWSHWGNSSSLWGRVDYPLHQTMLGIQQSVLSQLLDGERLSRIRDTEAKFGAENTVTIPELMGRLTGAIWQEIWSAPGQNIVSNRRDLQRAYLESMISIVTEADDEMPADAISVARMQLKNLSSRLASRLSPPTFEFDDYTRAHLEEAKARIDKALEAGLTLQN
ncbi:MAG: zinc-dependent metalloprotease [Balneolaceae bacterium]|nr:zinc-dependent metalloprotease [Balneolaceae bacterium]